MESAYKQVIFNVSRLSVCNTQFSESPFLMRTQQKYSVSNEKKLQYIKYTKVRVQPAFLSEQIAVHTKYSIYKAYSIIPMWRGRKWRHDNSCQWAWLFFHKNMTCISFVLTGLLACHRRGFCSLIVTRRRLQPRLYLGSHSWRHRESRIERLMCPSLSLPSTYTYVHSYTVSMSNLKTNTDQMNKIQ